jgi:hypothetical protein
MQNELNESQKYKLCGQFGYMYMLCQCEFSPCRHLRRASNSVLVLFLCLLAWSDLHVSSWGNVRKIVTLLCLWDVLRWGWVKFCFLFVFTILANLFVCFNNIGPYFTDPALPLWVVADWQLLTTLNSVVLIGDEIVCGPNVCKSCTERHQILFYTYQNKKWNNSRVGKKTCKDDYI